MNQPAGWQVGRVKPDNNYSMYIGDSDSDSKASSDAGVPFVFVTYGFGKTDKYTYTFDSFLQLGKFFLNI